MLKRAAGRGKTNEGKTKLLSFRYTAQAEQGRAVKGSVKAISEVAAQNLLVRQGYTPLTLEPVASPLSLEGALPSLFGIKPDQIVSFSNQLATLLESGVSLLPALQLLEGQSSSSKAFERVIRSIAQDLGTGKPFAAAIARHPTVFSEIYIRTISVGDRTGNLQTVLRQMAEYIEKQGAFAKKSSKALAYPIGVFVIGIIVSVILLVVVLPPLADMFASLGVDLPLPTRILLAASDSCVHPQTEGAAGAGPVPSQCADYRHTCQIVRIGPNVQDNVGPLRRRSAPARRYGDVTQDYDKQCSPRDAGPGQERTATRSGSLISHVNTATFPTTYAADDSGGRGEQFTRDQPVRAGQLL